MSLVPPSATTPSSLSDLSSSLSSTMSSVSASGSSGSTSTNTGPDPPSSSTALNSSLTIASSDPVSSAPSSSTTSTSSSTSTETTATTSSSTTEPITSTTSTDTTSSTSTSDTSTPTPTSPTAVPTSSPSVTSPSSSSTDTAPSSTSSSSVPLSTIVQTTVITQNGQTSTIVTSQIAASGTAGADGSSSSGSGSNSHTGAIVGGVVGGIALIALLALLAWFIRRRRNKSEFDGNFDPDHVAKRDSSPLQRLGRGGDADLLAAAHGVDDPEVTPYMYGMEQQQPGGVSFLGPAAAAGLGAGAGYAAGQGYGGRDQKGAGPLGNNSYYNPNAPAMPSGPSEAGSGSGSGHGLTDPRTSLSSNGIPYGVSPYPPVSGPGAGAGYGIGMPIPGMYQPTPAAGTPSLPTSHSTYSTYSGAPSKEREAFAARYAQQVGQGQNAQYGGADAAGGPSGSAPLTLRNGAAEDEAQNVVVHQDGGRVREDVAEPMNEIPPTYDSIRSDEEHH